MDMKGEMLSPDQVTALLSQFSRRPATGIRNRALVTVMYRSGLRVAEAVDVRMIDLNIGERSIRLPRTKSGKPQTAWLHPGGEDALLRWIDKRKDLGYRSPRCLCPPQMKGQPWQWNTGCRAHLFCTLDGGPMSANYVRDMIRRTAAAAGIEARVHPHALRHTYAVELHQNNTPISVISKLLRHGSIATTARYLDHLTNSEAGAFLQTVDLPPVAA